jgi:hypothetical protein
MFDVEGAKKAGYTDREIAAHLGRRHNFDVAGAQRAGWKTSDIVAHLMQREAPIPGAEGEIDRRAAAQAQPAPSIGQRIVGAGEAALTAGTGATGGALGMIGGTLGGLAGAVAAGDFGTPEAAQRVEQTAAAGAERLTYAPRTQAGQDIVQNVLAPVGEALMPVAGLTPQVAALARSASQAVAPTEAAARSAAASTQQAASRASAALQGEALEFVRARVTPRTPETESGARTTGPGGAVGAQATDAARQRATTAASFDIPIRLTRGEAEFEEVQLGFEKAQRKSAQFGAPLRERADETRRAIVGNLDIWIDKTGAEGVFPGQKASGAPVVKALFDGAEAAKARTRAAYKEARNSPEAQTPVETAGLIEFLNGQPSGVPQVGILDATRQYAVALGVARKGPDGRLAPVRTTIAQTEELRQSINRVTGYDAADIAQSTILKQLLDGDTGPVADNLPLYRRARQLRRDQARLFEDRAIVADFLASRKSGSLDPKVSVDPRV